MERHEPPLSAPNAPGQTEPVDFGARTPWSAGGAIAFALIALGIAIGLTWIAQPLSVRLGPLLIRQGDSLADHHGLLASSMLAMLLMQGTLLGLVWWGAGRFGGQRHHVLSLQRALPVKALAIGVAGMVALLVPYNLLVYLVWPTEFARDLRPFWELARSPALWLATLVVTIGAPLSEEMLFRGFLLPALTKTVRGFAGAAVLSTVGWTALHVGYSLLGLIEITLIGLYFCWLMWRFGNLWLPIILHAIYNGLQLVVLALLPGGPGSFG